jgi:hypothetical protein
VEEGQRVDLGHSVRLESLRDAQPLDDRVEHDRAAAAHRREAARAQRGVIVAVEVGMLEHRLEHRIDGMEHGAALLLDQHQRAERIPHVHENQRGPVAPRGERDVEAAPGRPLAWPGYAILGREPQLLAGVPAVRHAVAVADHRAQERRRSRGVEQGEHVVTGATGAPPHLGQATHVSIRAGGPRYK